MTDVSVIIPAYNATKTIAAAIGSVLDQTVRPLEIIVVDDGSRDATADMVAAMAPSVTLLRQANQGCGQARNTGARIAQAPWLAFLDADDTWLPRKLERQLPLTNDPRVAVVNCGARDRAGHPMPDTLAFDTLWERNDMVVSSTLVRRSVFESEGGFWAERACEDYHLWLRLAAKGWIIANCPEDLVVYSPAPGSLSQQTESFAAAEFTCITDVASRLGLQGRRVRDRLIAGHRKHVLGAIHHRNFRVARRLAWKSLALGVSATELGLLALAYIPQPVFDVRRRWLGHGDALPGGVQANRDA